MVDTRLTGNERRLLRNALRAYSACPPDDRDACVALLYRLEREEGLIRATTDAVRP